MTTVNPTSSADELVSALMQDIDTRIARASKVPLPTYDIHAIASREGIVETSPLLTVQKFVARDDSSSSSVIALVDGTGNGKTFAASWAMAEYDGSDYSTAPRIARFRFRPDGDEEWSRICNTPGPLFIDELGMESVFIGDELTRLLDERIACRRKTVFISHLWSNEIRRRYSLTSCTFHTFHGHSLRRMS